MTTAAETSVAIVTGASSGIGREVALRLASQERTVVAAARRTEELDELVCEIERRDGRAVAVPTDVRELDAIQRLTERAEAIGPVDALVNVAGLGHVHSVMAADEDVVALLEVNLLAPMRLMRAVVPGMRERGRGSIVNIGSLAGELGIDGAYSASKFGLRGMTDSVRRELYGTGIEVSLIEPGFIATPMTADRTDAMPGPEMIAVAVERCLARPRRRMIVPGRYRAAVLLGALAPGVVDRRYAGSADDTRRVPAQAPQ